MTLALTFSEEKAELTDGQEDTQQRYYSRPP